MRALQVGILAALIICAGLLYKIYRGQEAAPAPVAAEAQSAAEPQAPAAAEPAALTQPEPVAPAAVRARKPSPARRVQSKAPETLAESRPPVATPPPAPAPQVAEPVPPPPSPEPAPERVALNPPPGTETAPPPARVPQTVTIPAGTLITVRLAETLSSEKNQQGDTFAATLDQPLVVEGLAIAERGARVRGKVVEAERAGRVKGVAVLGLALTNLHTSDGQDVTLVTERFVKEGPTSRGDDIKKVGVGAALGAAIGAIAGGGKGAAIGAGVGGAAGAGTVAATRGKASELPVETRLTFRLEEPITLTERIR